MTRGMRLRRTLRWSGLATLGLLLLRSLIPAGVMLSVQDGQLAITLCSLDASGGAHHAYHDGDHAGHTGVHPDPTCPYAQSSGPALLPTVPLLAGAAPLRRFLEPSPVTSLIASPGPPREQFPRGPPSLV